VEPENHMKPKKRCYYHTKFNEKTITEKKGKGSNLAKTKGAAWQIIVYGI